MISLFLAVIMALSLFVGAISAMAADGAQTDVTLMSITRTAVNAAADAGNQFNADSGVFADVSNLTAWNNNTQRAIGYAGSNRTPIVFNNAAAPAWRSVGSAAVDAGITVDTASAFQIKFETTGYDNIRLSCSQKSTGSGPESFQLAYSIGSPTGPYTVIPDSRHDNVRISNDTYAALQPSYANFTLPAEIANQSEVYLRVYMVDSALSDRSNGNTSINDITIVGDKIGGSGNVDEPVTLSESYLSLAPGADASKLNFSWHDAATTGSPIVRVWKDGGEKTEFTGIRSLANSTLSAMRYNRVTVTGLEPNTTYNYRLGDGNGNWSATYTTKTGSPDSYSYLVFGDPQVSSQTYGNQWKNTLDIALNMFPNFSFMSSTGDQIDSATKAQYDYFFTPKAIFNSLPMASAIGNHETTSTSSLMFNPPNADSSQNYWYRNGDTLFMVWNSTAGNAAGMRTFLTNAIAANPDAAWKILNFHYDVYGQGDSHALSDGKTYRDTYVPVIDEFGIDVVFNGHDHFYSRSYPMKWSGSASTSNSQGMQPQIQNSDGSYTIPDGGTVYFSLSSSSGQKYYGAAARQPYTAFMPTSQSNLPQFSIVGITADSFTCTTYELSNYTATATVTMIDTYTIVKKSGTVDPEVPVDLILTTNKNIVRPDEYFNVSVSFPEKMDSNVIKMDFTFEGGKFDFAGFTPADGAMLLTREYGNGFASIMVMVPDYVAESLGSLMLKANSGVAVSSSTIAATATFVQKDETGDKAIKEANGSYTQKTNNAGTEEFVVDMIVLSNLIDAFGMTSDDPNWDTVSHFDFNGNGMIDIFDITTLAQMIK